MALSPTSSRGGTSPYQTGAGSPAGAVTPTSIGSLYIDTTHGALYIAYGATSAGWAAVGGNSGAAGDVAGVVDTGTFVQVLANGGAVVITDVGAYDGTGNGLYYAATGVDGTQTVFMLLGSTGQFTHMWAADGTYDLPVAAAAATNAPRLSQLSPKFTITSGALPTVQLVTATGAQILTTRDAETITPCTFNPGAATTATVTVELSPDNVTYSTLGVETEPAGVAFDGTIHLVKVRVPAGWYLKLTVNAQAVLGLTTYY